MQQSSSLPTTSIEEFPLGSISSSSTPVAVLSPHVVDRALYKIGPPFNLNPPTKTPVLAPALFWFKLQLWFNTYRKFFTVVITFNVVGIALAATGVWKYPRHFTSAFVLGNLLCAILMRNELFGRFLYLLANALFAKWSPLWVRLACTSVLQHLGGIHSGCATSGCLWLIYRMVEILSDSVNTHLAVVITGVFTLTCVLISMLSAFPWLRNTHHNTFEFHHRFVGWLGLLCTWVFVILGDCYDFDAHGWNFDARKMFYHQDLYFCLFMTVFVVIPWCTVREVSVDIDIPSSKVAILRFNRGMQQGLLSRISRNPLYEYHAFGIISEGVNAQYHYLICGVQGDFTRSLVEKPPSAMWTRQLKFAGVSNTSKLYKRGIRVCTGTGLGSALSTCLQDPNWYLIWIGSDQEKTFGTTIYRLVHDNLQGRATLWDSKKEGGRPDTMQLLIDTYYAWGAEVVFITTNMTGNTEMMLGCKAAGIPAFGTLWDF